MANEIKESKKVKSGKKAFYKRWWFKVFAVIVVLSALTSNNDSNAPEAPEAPEMAPSTEMVEITDPVVIESQKDTGDLVEEFMETEASTEPTETVQETEEEMEEISYTIDDAMALLKLSIKDNYDNYEVYNEGDMIFVNVWNDNIALGAMMAVAGNTEYKEAWNTMVNSTTNMCDAMHNLVLNCGLDNTHVTVNVVNDTNTELVLLSITDGVVMYDSVNMG